MSSACESAGMGWSECWEAMCDKSAALFVDLDGVCGGADVI